MAAAEEATPISNEWDVHFSANKLTAPIAGIKRTEIELRGNYSDGLTEWTLLLA